VTTAWARSSGSKQTEELSVLRKFFSRILLAFKPRDDPEELGSLLPYMEVSKG
jgi:hypothetical protein